MSKSLNHLPSKSLILAVLCLLISGCGTESNSEQKADSDKNADVFRSYAVNIEKPGTRFADAFESVELLQLEETRQSLLGSVARVRNAGDKLIFPGYNNGEIYIFSDQGKFLSKFNNTGEAEGQYSSVQDLWVSGDSIVIFDSKKRTIYWYQHNGDYLKSVKMPEGTGHVYPVGQGFLTDMTFAPAKDSVGYKVHVLDGQLRVKNELVPNPNPIAFPMGRNTNSFKEYHGKLTFKAMYDDTTYFLNTDVTTPFIHVNFGEKNLWKDESLKGNLMAVMTAIPKGEGVWNYTPYVNSDLIYMTYDISLKKLAAVIDRETGAHLILNTLMKNEERFDLEPIAWDGDRLMLSMPSSNVAELLEGMDAGQWRFAAGASLESIESSENPVLLWVKFKNLTEGVS
ncbi:MAG: 6-bladed beta-propeller [Roseivirga sp.]|nr:6-bladed beta-propeller [Roseivirga sp.]